MYKKILLLLTMLLLTQGCKEPIFKEQIMNLETKHFIRYENYTTETYDKQIEKTGDSSFELENGTKMQFDRPYFKDTSTGNERTNNGFIKIIPAYPALYRVSKYYHAETKILISQGISIGSQMVGVFQKFNKYGKLIQEIDIEKKDWSKYHYRDVLKFLDEKKIINLKTGEGRGTFDFYLDESNGTAKWIIDEIENDENRWIRSKYTVNANTMEVLKLEKEQRGIE